MQLQPGTLLDRGKYRIIESIGRGGFGVTYLAEQVMAKRKVCIKEFFPKGYYLRDENTNTLTLTADGFADSMNRYKAKFIKEAQTIATLDHSNIIHIFDVFEENATAYYVMEYVEGESLNDRVKRYGALSEAEAIGYIRQISAALEYIHNRQLMHLDVKPSNIMLRKDNGRVILIDFGLSKHYDVNSGEVTTTTPVGVSHGYAPIEQYQEGGVNYFSPQTDIYSLGATLYYSVTASVPLQAALLINNPLNLPQGLSLKLRYAIERAMSAVVANRPCSVKEFLALLDDRKETNVIGAPSDKTKVDPTRRPIPVYKPISVENKPLPPTPKNRWWIWLLLVLVVVAVGVFYWGYPEEKAVADTEPSESTSESSDSREDERIKNLLASYYQYVLNKDFSSLKQMYAPQVERYYDLRNISREEIIKKFMGYDEIFKVKPNSTRYNIDWNTVKISNSGEYILVEYELDYSMERYGASKYAWFHLRIHLTLNDSYEIVGIYEDILDKR